MSTWRERFDRARDRARGPRLHDAVWILGAALATIIAALILFAIAYFAINALQLWLLALAGFLRY